MRATLQNALLNRCMALRRRAIKHRLQRTILSKSWRILMSEKHNSAVGLFSNHHDAESAVKELQKCGYDMKKLSVVGKDYHSEENVIGYYNTEDSMATWGKF